MQNFPQQLQTPISQKQTTFSGLFIAFLECASNLEHFEKKDEHPSLIITEIIHSEKVGYLNVKMSCFRTPFGKQRVNEFQTVLKSERHHYCRIFP